MDVASNNNIESNVDAKALSDNTFNTGLFNTGDIAPSFSGKGAANAIGMIAIARHPEKLAELRESNAEGIVRAYRKYREAMPWLNDQQAFLFAAGTPTTPEGAFSVFDVLGKAANLLEERSANPQEPSDAKATKMLEGAKNSEEWARDKWAKLIAGELESPGSYSKRAMAILDDMSQDDALQLEKLCTLCIGGKGTEGAKNDIIPYLVSDKGGFTFNDGAISRKEIENLRALGILAPDGRVANDVDVKVNAFIAGEPICVLNPTGTKKQLEIGEVALTEQGSELAALCPCGTAPGFADFVKRDIERQGFKIVSQSELARALATEPSGNLSSDLDAARAE